VATALLPGSISWDFRLEDIGFWSGEDWALAIVSCSLVALQFSFFGFFYFRAGASSAAPWR